MYALSRIIITPFSRSRNDGIKNHSFNTILSSKRVFVENEFSMLKKLFALNHFIGVVVQRIETPKLFSVINSISHLVSHKGNATLA